MVRPIIEASKFETIKLAQITLQQVFSRFKFSDTEFNKIKVALVMSGHEEITCVVISLFGGFKRSTQKKRLPLVRYVRL